MAAANPIYENWQQCRYKDLAICLHVIGWCGLERDSCYSSEGITHLLWLILSDFFQFWSSRVVLKLLKFILLWKLCVNELVYEFLTLIFLWNCTDYCNQFVEYLALNYLPLELKVNELNLENMSLEINIGISYY